MIVVIMVGVLVTLAIPAISTQMRDRRTNQAAHEVAMPIGKRERLPWNAARRFSVRYDATGQGKERCAKRRRSQRAARVPASYRRRAAPPDWIRPITRAARRAASLE